MRKTRKGGSIANIEKLCVKPKSTFEACVKDFLEEKGFNRIKVPGDGNCFYHVLTKFLKLSQNGSLPDKYHLTIRNIVVDKMMENIEDVAPYLTGNDSAADQIKSLRVENEWNSDASDIVSQYASKALNIKLIIYDVKNPKKASKIFMRRVNGKNEYKNEPAMGRHIVSYVFDPEVNTGIVARMLRIGDGHYELLYPAAHVSPKRPKSPKSPERKSPGTPKRVSPERKSHKSPERKSPERKSPKSPERNKTLKKEMHKQSRIEEVLANKSITEKQRMAKLRRLGINI